MIKTYINIKRPKDIVKFNTETGVFTWGVNHKHGTLASYLSDMEEKIQIMWEDDGMVPYHGW